MKKRKLGGVVVSAAAALSMSAGAAVDTLVVPTARGQATFLVDNALATRSPAMRVNADMIGKDGVVPAPTPGYELTSKVVLRGTHDAVNAAVAALAGARTPRAVTPVAGAPEFVLVDGLTVRGAAELAMSLRGAGFEDAYVDMRRPMPLRSVPTDPELGQQWHLINALMPAADINVEGAWNAGFSGAGVTIGILEGGFQIGHPDLYANRNEDASQAGGSATPHGTCCAGVAAGIGNNAMGGAGVAFGAKVSQLLYGSDTANATAFGFKNELNWIKSNSWGPTDGGFIASMSPVEFNAIQSAVNSGRGGRGTIFTWAAGNGGTVDRVDYDGYASSRYVVSVGAIGDEDFRAYYNELGSSHLVVAPSNGNTRGIYTTDVTGGGGYSSGDYTPDFGGTSSACPLGAGVVALMLEANPDLSWRDVQHILILTARKCDEFNSQWSLNGAGRWVSYHYGFGAINASAAVALAQTWQGVEPERSATTDYLSVSQGIPDNNTTGLTKTATINAGITIETVEVVLNVTHPFVGDLQVTLTAPSGKTSALAAKRNDPTDNYNEFVFTTRRHFGESAKGTWTLHIADRAAQDVGTWLDWRLNVFGTGCLADFNADGFVNGNDYDAFADAFDQAAPEADLNADGFVNGNDYDAFATAFDQGC
ncbi:MAG: S8 family serine peptidase [Phycisphaerae bacterium]|nr:S8 family serine peptidase [Phycisphaerae bacterium]